MKRQQLLRHLREHGCEVVGEGGRHTRVHNPANGQRSVVPRHREIKPTIVREVCKQLGIPVPRER
jgi:mRNA interferase HicA